VCYSPPIRGKVQPPLDEVRLTFDKASREIAKLMPEVRLLLGAENYWDDILATDCAKGNHLATMVARHSFSRSAP